MAQTRIAAHRRLTPRSSGEAGPPVSASAAVASTMTGLKKGEVDLGTSIMAVSFGDGVIVGADSRTSTGTYIANRVSDKLTPVHDRVYCCRSGSAADTQAISDIVRVQLGTHATELGRLPSVKTAATLFQRYCYEYKDRLMAGIICAGFDEVEGGSVYSIPLGGAMIKQPFAIGGSGSTYIYAYCDANYRDNMTRDEAHAFVKKALSHAMARDGSSGGVIRTAIIDKNGELREAVPSGSELTLALETLAKVTGNALTHGAAQDGKFLRLRQGNVALHNRLLRFAPARRMLEALGFAAAEQGAVLQLPDSFDRALVTSCEEAVRAALAGGSVVDHGQTAALKKRNRSLASTAPPEHGQRKKPKEESNRQQRDEEQQQPDDDQEESMTILCDACGKARILSKDDQRYLPQDLQAAEWACGQLPRLVSKGGCDAVDDEVEAIVGEGFGLVMDKLGVNTRQKLAASKPTDFDAGPWEPYLHLWITQAQELELRDAMLDIFGSAELLKDLAQIGVGAPADLLDHTADGVLALFATRLDRRIADRAQVERWQSRARELKGLGDAARRGRETDWLVDFDQLRPHVEALVARKDAEILHIGCGTSPLPAALHQAGYRAVTCVDFCEQVVDDMRHKHASLGFDWVTMDCRSMDGLPSSCFDVVLDKALYDCVACSERSAAGIGALLGEVHRVLKKNGLYLVVSAGTPGTRLPYFERSEHAWALVDTLRFRKDP
ncbi:Proteasome subunit beta type-6 (Differentiation-associated proteasome subunit 1) (DAPS-1), partial [Durusdinium trenchii]